MQRLLLLRVCGTPRPLTLSYIGGKKLKYACAKALLRMPESKKGRITREIQKSLALAGSLFLRKKGITLIYAMWGIDLSLFRVDPRGDPWRTSKQQLVQVYTHKYYYKYFWQVSTSGVTIGLVLIYVCIQ